MAPHLPAGRRHWNVRLPLRHPWSGVTFRDATIIDGPAGFGEASPLPGFDCDPARARRSAEEAADEGWPAPRRHQVPVNAVIAALDPVTAAAEARAATGQGIVCLKVKVGAGDDLGRVSEIRNAVGPAVKIRVDANGAWDLDTACRRLRALARYDLELAEQPVASLEEMARLRRLVDVPLAADEAVRGMADARRLVRLGAADVVVVKVQPLGGVRAALAVVETAGLPAIVTSMLETSVGLAAGLALAAALPELPFACGLATATLLAADVTTEPLVPRHGMLDVRPVVPDVTLLERYST
ncbi:MAG TPA: enolase C-terminal domain-like protein [Acidimicrobiales bacterium]|nr:enolase C-terminal domain-like protein [Acidimicrobiales bacterium]